MANYLKVSVMETIWELHRRGWSQRRIARELGISRVTVARYVAVAEAESGPGVPAGAERRCGESRPGVPTGSTVQSGPGVPAGCELSQSRCLPHAGLIEERLAAGLTAQRIWQDLVAEQGFAGSYDSVKRYVRRLRATAPEPFRRLECEAGAEAQLDFGQGAWVVDAKGKRRRPQLFRIVLSHSRKAYSEVVWRQDTESVIRVLENAFRSFGGVPRTLVPDNMKCAVLRADWADPELNPKLLDFCRHYGTVLLPTKVRTPRHKGKVERAVGYAQDNALKGRSFPTLEAQNAFLRQWEAQVADTRIHGTTREQVRAAFAREKPQLLPLPAMLFPCFAEGLRKVHRDGHVEVARSFYSAPPEYVGRELWVRWDLRTVRLHDPRDFRQVRLHCRVPEGRFQTDWRDIPERKIAAIEHGEHYLLRRLNPFGANVQGWARAMLQARGIEGLRVLVGLIGLTGKHPPELLDAACREARKRQQWRLRELRARLREAEAPQPDLQLQQQHEIIRDLGAYQALVGHFH